MLLNLTQPKSIISLVKYALGRDAHSITACFGIPDAQPPITNLDKVEYKPFPKLQLPEAIWLSLLSDPNSVVVKLMLHSRWAKYDNGFRDAARTDKYPANPPIRCHIRLFNISLPLTI